MPELLDHWCSLLCLLLLTALFVCKPDGPVSSSCSCVLCDSSILFVELDSQLRKPAYLLLRHFLVSIAFKPFPASSRLTPTSCPALADFCAAPPIYWGGLQASLDGSGGDAEALVRAGAAMRGFSPHSHRQFLSSLLLLETSRLQVSTELCRCEKER